MTKAAWYPANNTLDMVYQKSFKYFHNISMAKNPS
jgi:hypothetical protein